MANRPAAVRILLYGLATFLTFTAVYLCGFKLTGTLTYTAMMMLMNSTTAQLRKKYVFQRCIGQILGLGCGWCLYYGIGQIPGITQPWQILISMPLAVMLAMGISHKWKLGLSDMLVCSPVLLICLMSGSYGKAYPLYRGLYTILGIIIGYALPLFIMPADYHQNFLNCSKQLSDLIKQTEHPTSTSVETMKQLHLQQKNEINWLCDDISPFKKYKKISTEVLERYHFLVRANGLWVDFLSSYATLEKHLSKSFENEVRQAVRFLQPLHAQASDPKEFGKWPMLKNQLFLSAECHEDTIVSGELSKYICFISQKGGE